MRAVLALYLATLTIIVPLTMLTAAILGNDTAIRALPAFAAVLVAIQNLHAYRSSTDTASIRRLPNLTGWFAPRFAFAASAVAAASLGLLAVRWMTSDISIRRVLSPDLTPGTSPVAITQGYHDDTGSVVGDAYLGVAPNITGGVNNFGVTGTALPAQRLKTGQTTCYNAAGSVIACAGTGQDGELQKGLTVSYTDNGDGTITDNRTGLMWEKLSDDGSIHDKDTWYTWTNAFASKVATLNSGSFAGYNDWRVPNVNELQSLANYGAAVNAPFNTGCVASCTVLTCSCTQSSSAYWSSTTYQDNSSLAWYVFFYNGSVNAGNKAGNGYVRAVRAGS